MYAMNILENIYIRGCKVDFGYIGTYINIFRKGFKMQYYNYMYVITLIT